VLFRSRISHFGLMEMSRQRIRASVLESTMDVCSHCQGLGLVRSDSAIALHVFRSVEEHLAKHSRYDIIVKTTPSIALYILNHKRTSLLELEERMGLRVMFEGDQNIVGQEFSIEKGESAKGTPAKVISQYQEIPNQISDEVSDEEPERDAAAADEDGTDRKKRRRRRRGKRRPENHEETSGETEPEESAELVESQSNSEPDDDQQSEPKRNRRRGRRGGKRKNTETDPNVSADAGEIATPAEPISEPVETASTTTNIVDETAEEERPSRVRRSTKRPRKAKSLQDDGETAGQDTSISENAEPAMAQTSTVETVSESVEPSIATAEVELESKSPRRNTRRPKKSVVASVDETVSEDQPAEINAVAEEVVVEAAPEEKPEEEKKPRKKGGWWGTGGFFK